jgi:putative phosphoesterase
MRIAVLADIHGNYMALETVLKDIRINNIDKIIVLGDLITDFPEETNNVLDTVKNITKNVVKGNRELYIMNFDKKYYDYSQFKTIYQTFDKINKNNFEYLSTLPEQISININDEFSIKCVHGSPFLINEKINENDNQLIEKSLKSIDEKILLCGHTHLQWFHNKNGKYIINPGSVGVSLIKGGIAQYTVMDFKKDKIEIDQKNIYYEYKKLKRKYINEQNLWTELIIKSIEDGIDYGERFFKEVKKFTEEWPIPNKEWDLLFKEWYKKGVL